MLGAKKLHPTDLLKYFCYNTYMKKTFIILLLIILLFLLIGFCFYNDTNFSLNFAYAIISSMSGVFVVLIFLDQYYKAKKEHEEKRFIENFKLKIYSNFILMDSYIQTFLKCDPNIIKSRSCRLGRIHSSSGDVFEDVDDYTKTINNLIDNVKKQSENEYTQEQRFDYCICFIRLMKNIKQYLEHIIEISQFIPTDNIKIKELFQDILFTKQNLERLNSIIEDHISFDKYKDYTNDTKSNSVAILETTNSIDCFTIVDCMLKNIEQLLQCLKALCSEKELKEFSKLIK